MKKIFALSSFYYQPDFDSVFENSALAQHVNHHLICDYKFEIGDNGRLTAQRPNIFSGNLTAEEFEVMIAPHIEGFERRNSTGISQNTPLFWSTAQEEWQIYSNFDDQVFQSQSTNYDSHALALFLKLGPQHFGLIAITYSATPSSSLVEAFHSRSMIHFDNIKGQIGRELGMLSRNERNCLVWSACGKTSGEIAIILSLSEHTVNHYFSIAATKLKANNRTHAAAKAIRMGLISFDEIN